MPLTWFFFVLSCLLTTSGGRGSMTCPRNLVILPTTPATQHTFQIDPTEQGLPSSQPSRRADCSGVSSCSHPPFGNTKWLGCREDDVTRTCVRCPGESFVEAVERATTPAHNLRFVPDVYRAVIRPVREDIGSEGCIECDRFNLPE